MEQPSTLNKGILKAMHYDMVGEETIISSAAIEAGLYDSFKAFDSIYSCDLTDEILGTLSNDFDYEDEYDEADEYFKVYTKQVGQEDDEFEMLFIQFL